MPSFAVSGVPSPARTKENLNDAVAAEVAEREDTYTNAFEACVGCRDAEAARVFDETRDAEVEHANLCTEALHKIESMRTAKEYNVCSECGYITTLRLGFCPLCRRTTQ